MSHNLTDTVRHLRSTEKTANHSQTLYDALATAVRAAPLRPVTVDDFHAVKQADWKNVTEAHVALTEKLSSDNAHVALASAVRLAGIDDLVERRTKIASAVKVVRALTLLERGST